LVTLSSTLKEWAETLPAALQGDIAGLLDVNDILEETLKDIPGDKPGLQPLRRHIEKEISGFRHAVHGMIREPGTTAACIGTLVPAATSISKQLEELDTKCRTAESRFAVNWVHCLTNACHAHTHDAIGKHDIKSLSRLLLRLGKQARKYAFDMKFDFLKRKERLLLSIGYRVQEHELDESCYDLLASKARLSSLFAIAKGDIKVEHWFQLGRMLVPVGWKGALLSWSGSMFEYLMPPLVMREPFGSLLDQTNRLVVHRQIAYAHELGLPWGISEAAFNARDPMMQYQYSNFGVPILGCSAAFRATRWSHPMLDTGSTIHAG